MSPAETAAATKSHSPVTPLRPTSASQSGRLNVKIGQSTAEAMTRLLAHDRNATEVVRRAIALLDLVTTETEAGKYVELVDEAGERERLRLLY